MSKYVVQSGPSFYRELEASSPFEAALVAIDWGSEIAPSPGDGGEPVEVAPGYSYVPGELTRVHIEDERDVLVVKTQVLYDEVNREHLVPFKRSESTYIVESSTVFHGEIYAATPIEAALLAVESRSEIDPHTFGPQDRIRVHTFDEKDVLVIKAGALIKELGRTDFETKVPNPVDTNLVRDAAAGRPAASIEQSTTVTREVAYDAARHAIVAPRNTERDAVLNDTLNAHTAIRDAPSAWKTLSAEAKVSVIQTIERTDAPPSGRLPARIEVSEEVSAEGAFDQDRNVIVIPRDAIEWPEPRPALMSLWVNQRFAEHAASAEFRDIKDKADAIGIQFHSNARSLSSDTSIETCHEEKGTSSRISVRETANDSSLLRRDGLRHAAVRMHMFNEVGLSQARGDRDKAQHVEPGHDVTKRINDLKRQHGEELEKGI